MRIKFDNKCPADKVARTIVVSFDIIGSPFTMVFAFIPNNPNTPWNKVK